MTHQETHLPVDGAACCTETSLTVYKSSRCNTPEDLNLLQYCCENHRLCKNNHSAYRWLYLHGSGDWWFALILFLAIMKSLLLPPPPTFMVAIYDYICIRCLFSGCVNNIANGKRMEHQYRVDKKALYTHLLTVRICIWTLCAMLSVPLHMTGTYSYCQCCHTPPSSFTVCHVTPHAHTDWRGRYIREQ
jgi:hypothetical protein